MTGGVMGLVLPKGRLLKRWLSGCLRAVSRSLGSVIQFWLRPVWSPRRPIYAALRYQLVALATYLPKGYLVAAATYLRCATVSVGRHVDLSRQASVQRLGLSERSRRNGREKAQKTQRALKVRAGVRRGGLRVAREKNSGKQRLTLLSAQAPRPRVRRELYRQGHSHG